MPGDQVQLNAKLDSLAAVINEQEPHVHEHQEIGSESALARLPAWRLARVFIRREDAERFIEGDDRAGSRSVTSRRR